ncbi:MAG: hypothetical protein HZB26_01415 [Candidatus Hydrogenedentes bacterium]|nr:hypothetical protein [Candidatus Hydrogenedentota bacterium]
MKTLHKVFTIPLFVLTALVASATPVPETVIVIPKSASALERFAAHEVRRYVYLRTNQLLPLTVSPTSGQAIVLGRKDQSTAKSLVNDPSLGEKIDVLGPQDYLIETRVSPESIKSVYLIGGSDVSVLYAAYRFAEHLGVRFYLHGDVIPDQRILLELPDVHERRSPLFTLRGIQPFHDFPEGPDWWDLDDYRAIIAQLPKLGMNFIGLHTYPVVEPTVWIGQAADVAKDGRVEFSYPTRYFNTALTVGWGFQAKKTDDYACGAGALFDRNDYGSDFMLALTPQPTGLTASNEMFNRTGVSFDAAFSWAHALGVKTCVGTETPLVVPEPVRARAGGDPDLVRKLYEGIFTRIMKTHPLDYYWLWTPENWTWETILPEQVTRTVDDILIARDALKAVKAPFQLATCGWVLGPQSDRSYLAKTLPKDIAVSCINRAVGHDPVEPAFAQVKGRSSWAIPWLEDDPAMTSPQLWAGRMRRDARDALQYGCDGLMGIHWRTRVLGPNVSALAQAAWDQSSWPKAADMGSRVIGGTAVTFAGAHFAGTGTDPIYQSVRYDMAAYRITAPDGKYRVTLRFCEPHYKEAGKRVFGVTLQGKRVIEGLDVFAKVGGNRALDYTFDDVAVDDGVINIEFVKQVEFPIIAAIEIQGPAFQQKINCGGAAYKDYVADLPVMTGHLPSDDFYSDWAAHEFGAEVGNDAACIFAAVDGKLPQPSNWIGGPGGYAPDSKPWDEVQKSYAFVDALAALRPRVVGPANLERFDYWVETFEYMRATARMCCVWADYNRALDLAKAESTPEARACVARDGALPARIALVRAVEDAYGHLIAAASTHGEMGTICNLEQHTFPTMLDAPGRELEQLLGAKLPQDAQLRRTFQGSARILAPTIRTSVTDNEALTIKAVILDAAPPRAIKVWVRELGARDFCDVPCELLGRSTYRARLAPQSAAFEYYVEAQAENGATLRWPVSAPEVNQTVTVMSAKAVAAASRYDKPE